MNSTVPTSLPTIFPAAVSTSAKLNLLVIDDEPLIIDSLKMILPKNWQLTSALTFDSTQKRQFFHAAFVDQHLSGNLQVAEGVEEIRKINQFNAKIAIVAMSGDMSLELMEKCLAQGASKFLAKPLSAEEVLATLQKIEALWQIREVETKGTQQKYFWVGESPDSEIVKKNIAALKSEEGPILIEGETGTGKEVVVRLLNAQEAPRPFVAVNIASIPENLFESELFGHVKGAFTGAEQMKVGLCEAANGGDLFLDEVEALPLSQQVKLLRFLESGEIRKVGSKEAQIIKTRVLIASNQNLSKLVKEGKFREDLLFRISGKKISLPPLRERTTDIPALAKFFLSHHKPRSPKFFANEAFVPLQKYSWPGNVRELKRICEQLALICPLPIIRAEDVQALLFPQLKEVEPSNSISSTALPQTAQPHPLSLAKQVENFEAHIIRQCLKQESDVEKIAEQLQISRSSLYKKIKDYQLQEES